MLMRIVEIYKVIIGMPVIKSSDYGARDSFICLFFFSNPQDILEKKSSFKEQLYLLKNVNLKLSLR